MTSIDFRAIRAIRTNNGSPTAVVTRNDAENAVRLILTFLGDDATRGGLRETPAHFIQHMEEAVAGQMLDPAESFKTAPNEAVPDGELIVVRDLHFTSIYEHDLSPIFGIAYIGYLPEARLAVNGSIAQLVAIYARRFQTQERLTNQIAQGLVTLLAARGVGVVIEATHHRMASNLSSCVPTRLRTARFLGALNDNQALRLDFLRTVAAHEPPRSI